MTEFAFSRTSRAVLRALVPVICPPEAAPLADAIVDHMALTIGASMPLLRVGLAAGLASYDLGALPRYRRRARALTGADAEAYLASWESGPTPPQQQLAKALNQLMSLSCYEQPAMMEACGYRPAAWIDEVSRKRLAVYGDEARAQAAALLAPDPLALEGSRHGRR
ncbi:MAG: hypothetical protein NT062_21910 [Proteobacteria bacterium]|nr:hypothetical protein [Pseudomonadota bacterium]